MLPEYALGLVRGVEAHRCAIDAHLVATSENWSLNRMPIVDRSILRLATYEMMYVDDVPTSVTINEAVELAKDFGGEDESPRFVNGVLGRIAKRLDGDDGETAVEVGLEDGEAVAEDAPAEEAVAEASDAPAVEAVAETPDAPAEEAVAEDAPAEESVAPEASHA